MNIVIPDFALILLIGPPGCGADAFAARHFCAEETLTCRGFQPDAGDSAFAALLAAAGRWLEARKLVVVIGSDDAQRGALLALARQYHAAAVAVVFDLPRADCAPKPATQEYLDHQFSDLRQPLLALKKEGCQDIHVLRDPAELASARVTRQPLAVDRRDLRGPFDLIGDLHGCATELETLLEQMGYAAVPDEPLFPGGYARRYIPPPGRTAIFIGDLVDRGPRILDTFALVCAMTAAGDALCVVGNHDDKLLRKLRGANVTISHGLEMSLTELEALPPEHRAVVSAAMIAFFSDLPSHLALDGGRLVAAHAGIKAGMIARESKRIRDFTLYGETSGEVDEFGLPVRKNWAALYRGSAVIVYGHTAVARPEWLNNTIDIDTGCVYGGSLTALRYPEMELAQTPALRAYRESLRPLTSP